MVTVILGAFHVVMGNDDFSNSRHQRNHGGECGSGGRSPGKPKQISLLLKRGGLSLTACGRGARGYCDGF